MCYFLWNYHEEEKKKKFHQEVFEQLLLREKSKDGIFFIHVGGRKKTVHHTLIKPDKPITFSSANDIFTWATGI